MKREDKRFRSVGWMLLFALVVFCVQVFGTTVAKAAGDTFKSRDGLWQCEYVKEQSGETVVSVDGYNGTDRDLVIPEKIDGYEVRYIGRPSGWNSVVANRFDSITISDTVIGAYNVPFFTNANNLKFLYLGKNYGTYSPYGRDINMIKADDTYNIRAKEYRVSPENKVITAVDGVLYSKDMTELKLYPALKEDTTFTVPDGVTSIDSYAMNNLQYLENLVLPDGLREIGVYCCEGASIRSVNLPSSLTSLDHGIFNNSKLESIVFPETITEIGGYVFTGTPLKEVVIPDTIVSLGAGDFMNCDKLKSIVIGSGLASIGGNCFYGLTALENFEISTGNRNFKSEGGMLLTKDGSKLIQYAAAGNAKFILPKGVTEIGPGACYEMPFDEIIIPGTVVSVGDSAFEKCTKAETIYVPSSVTSFGSSVFSGCTSLKTATIDARVAAINSSTFSGCSALTEITLPETVTTVGDGLFSGGALRSVYLKSSKAPSVSYAIYIQGQDAMTELIKNSSNIRIFVPEGAQGYDVLPWSRMNIVYGDTVTAERLTLNPSSAVLNVGETVSIQIVVSPEDAVLQDVVWETSNREVASVNKDGRVKALSAGTATIKATFGRLSTECIVTVRGAQSDQSAQNFSVQTSGGTASRNYNAQNYTKWSSPMKSYLFVDAKGYLTRVEFMNNKLIYEAYSTDGILKESGSIMSELPLFGGFYASGAYRFVVYGQLNSVGSDSTEVVRIVKYDQNWNRVSSCSLYGENTKTPFDAGNLRFAEYGDTLYIRTSHTMYNGHQSNLQIAVDMSAMKIKDAFSGVANIDYGGYVSHSFNQFLQMDGEDLITLDHGDAYPRAAVLIKYPGINKTTFGRSSVEHFEALKFPGLTGNNNTGASLGGLEVSEHYYIFAGNYTNNSGSSVRNIFVNITGKDLLRNPETRMIYLTDYDANSKVTISTPQLVKVNEKTFLVLWNETDASGTTVHSQMIDENGNKITKEQSFHGSLSDCHPIVQNGQAVWYYTGTEKENTTTTPIFCRIALDGRETVDNLPGEEASTGKKKTLSDNNVSLNRTSYTFDGKAKTPDVTVKDGNKSLVKDIDYTISYSNNINVGTAKVIITGKGNYTGTVIKEFMITEAVAPGQEEKELSKCMIAISQTSYIYDGKAKMPAVTVKDGNKTLVENVDYTITYSNNINAGTAKVTVTGKGNYTGTVTKEFTIMEAVTPGQEEKELSECKITISRTSYIYDGKAKMPTVTVKDGNRTLVKNIDYTITYSDNVNIGTAKVIVTGKGNYTGTVTKEFIITEDEEGTGGEDWGEIDWGDDDNVEEPDEEIITISASNVSLSKTSYTYDGKAKRPTVTVEDGSIVLEEGVDYTVTYNNNINAGTAKVTVIGKGDYKGTVTKFFTISVKKGKTYKIGSYQYKVTAISTVSITGVRDNKIKNIIVPKTVNIGGKTFKVTAIGSNAFKNNKKITSVEIGENVTSIGASAFKNCKKLGNITIKSANLKEVGKNALKGIKSKAKIKVPAKKLSVYKNLLKNSVQSKKVKITK